MREREDPATHLTNKGLISRILLVILQFNEKTINKPVVNEQET